MQFPECQSVTCPDSSTIVQLKVADQSVLASARGRGLMLGCALGLVLLAGCSVGVRDTLGGRRSEPAPALATYAPNVEEWRSAGYQLAWVGYPFPAVTARDAIRWVEVTDSVVVVQEAGSVVSLLEANNGQLRWTNEVANSLTRFVGINYDATPPGRVIVSSESEVFMLASATGSMLTRERLPRVVNTRPVVMNGQAIYGSATGEVVSHRLGLGLKNWGFLAQGPIEASPVQLGESAAFVTQSGDVVFLDAFEGRLVGRNRTFGGVQSNPVTDGQAVYLASTDQSVWAFSATGQTIWRYRTPSRLTSQPTIIAETLFVTVPGDGLTALNAQSGAVRWNNTNVGGTVVGARRNRIVVFEDGTLTLLDPASGAVVSSMQTPGITRLLTDNPVDGNLYGITDSNLVVKFSPR